jgi:general secretion pathway protein G
MISSRGRLFFPVLFLAVAVVGLCVLPWWLSPRERVGDENERTLRQDLFALRQVISQYTLDKQRAPHSLDDLVKAGYLRQVPKDPFSGRADWTVDPKDRDIPAHPQEPGIIDVHSASNLTGRDGKAYSSW